MAENKKSFNTKLYAVVVFFVIAALLATITVTTFKSRYNGFNPEKVAVAYAESIVNRGDGYNAYKNSLISKNYKYGNYIREYYMYPVIYSESNYAPGDDTDALKGFNDESFMSDKTKNDDGTLAGQLIDTMYPYFVELLEKNGGWDNYDVIFTEYFKKLVEVREEIFGDKYMTDEIMFTALEANVSSYGDSLTGTDEIIDENTDLKTSEKTIGLYEKKYGENYKVKCMPLYIMTHEDLDAYKNSMDAAALSTYGISTDDIVEAATVTVDVSFNGQTVTTLEINVVRIGSTWYVDNTNTVTSELYTF